MHKFFTDQWRLGTVKQRRELLEAQLLGLRPVVIYLDDEEEALEVFKDRCVEFGLEPVISSDPEYVINFARRNKSRILMIISDYQMPEMNGFEFRNRILEVTEDVPFYILSGHVDRELALEGLRFKITDFISKPMAREKFLQLLTTEGEKQLGKIVEDYEILKSFTDDVVNISAELEERCLQLESEPQDLDTIARIFGLVHTIKGSSSFFEPRTLHLFAHSFEEKLKLVQTGKLAVSTGLISSWLSACDIIKKLNDEFISGEHHQHDVEEFKALLEVEEGSAVEPGTQASESERKVCSKDQKPADLKVSMQILNEFTHVSGELTVIRNMINKVVTSIEKQHPGDKDVQALGELLGEMHKINSDMQLKIADIRRVPVTHLVKPLGRNFRDTSKALGKDVEFIVEGEDLRLDNAIADTLSRCLVHLMRNSLDHGIEDPQTRIKLGKPSKGKLTLKFETINEMIRVSLSDDGNGINTEKIRQKVISTGLRSDEDAKKMNDEELYQMIFEAGFSTAVAVSEYSGRGVGMSMVKDSITQQNGVIKISSESGMGSKFVLELPVPKSVQIASCLFVETNALTFGIPQESILKIIDQNLNSECEIEKLEGGSFIRFQGRLVPVMSLARFLNLECEEAESTILVLESQGLNFAIVVGRVLDAEDAVIKPLQLTSLTNLGVFKGGTFLGDGQIGLIIDVQGIINKLQLKRRTIGPVQEKELRPLSNIITFTLAEEGVFAVPEEDIFRIEFMSRDSFMRSGDHLLAPYRESVMTLVDLGRQFSYAQKEESAFLVLVVLWNSRYVGLRVREVLDHESVQLDILPPLRKKTGIRGNILHEGKTIAVVNVDELAQMGVETDETEQGLVA